MATVTTTSNPTARVVNWLSPSAVSGSVSEAPLSKIVVDDSFTVAAKDAADESLVVMTVTLPSGYFYRINYLDWSVQAASRSAFDIANGFEQGASCEVSENGSTRYNFPVTNIAGRTSPAGLLNAFKLNPDSVGNDFGTWFTSQSNLWQPSRYLVDASQGVSIVRVQWIDSSTDATVAVTVNWVFEAMMFTLDQANNYGINSPQLIYF